MNFNKNPTKLRSNFVTQNKREPVGEEGWGGGVFFFRFSHLFTFFFFSLLLFFFSLFLWGIFVFHSRKQS